MKSLLCGLAAALYFASAARAEDLALENPDFANRLAGWTQVGWGNDNPGIVYSTTAGSHIYQTVPSHAISAAKLKYTVRYRIGSMDPLSGWSFPDMTVNLVTHGTGEGFVNKGRPSLSISTTRSSVATSSPCVAVLVTTTIGRWSLTFVDTKVYDQCLMPRHPRRF
jgi:hypothetical protein